MSHTITAMYRTSETAELVQDRLLELGVPERNVHVFGTMGREGDVDALHLPSDETSTYKQAIREGHAVVSAEIEDGYIDSASEAMRHPEEGVDIDAYEADYRTSPDYETSDTSDLEGEQTMAVGEERLTLGKRAIERGSAHVRTYVQEVPVEERIRLREERLTVDRRPADRIVTGAEADNLFQERDIEVTTRSEQAVVSKETVITGEVVVGKEVSEGEEVVQDTVRKIEVDVDRDRT